MLDMSNGSEIAWQNRLQFSDNLIAIHTNCFQNHQQLHNIKPPFTQFILANKGCGFAQTLRKLRLRQTSIVTRLYQCVEQIPVSLCVNGSRQ